MNKQIELRQTILPLVLRDILQFRDLIKQIKEEVDTIGHISTLFLKEIPKAVIVKRILNELPFKGKL